MKVPKIKQIKAKAILVSLLVLVKPVQRLGSRLMFMITKPTKPFCFLRPSMILLSLK